MSDFDKEKERERLRKKYEREQEKREATERMSELLLQGATMTNAHCSECGDPIFRYDGQEFCATCEKPVDRDPDETEGEEGDNGQEQIEVTSPSDDARVAFGGESARENAQTDDSRADAEQPARNEKTAPTQAATQQSGPRETTDREPGRQEADRPDGPATDTSRDAPAQRETDRTDRTPAESERPAPRFDSETGVMAARDSLLRTLQRFSEQAEATDDPQRAREYLAAAREAAETLAVLRQ